MNNNEYVLDYMPLLANRKKCMCIPIIVKNNDDRIQHNVGIMISDYIERKLVIGESINLFNVSTRLVDVDINDFEKLGKQAYIYDGVLITPKEQAYYRFVDEYKKLIVEFECE